MDQYTHEQLVTQFLQHNHNGINSQRLGSSATGIPLFWLIGNSLPSTTTRYYSNGIIAPIESNAQFPIPSSGTINNLYITTNSVQDASGSSVLTFRKNGADTAITITIPANAAAGVFSNTTNAFGVIPGDLIDIEFVNNATANSATVISTSFNLS